MSLWAWIMAFGLPFPLLAWRARSAFNRLPELPAGDTGDDPLPSLSIVVPARNEAGNLERLLPSLAGQAYPGEVEIIVVDDDSTDETARVAVRHGAVVNTVSDLPAGWLGKPRACHVGARAAAGDWLLFTDADTQHAPECARLAVRYACDRQLDGLSLLLQEHPAGLLSRLAMMAAFAGLFAGLGSRPVLNGQFILIRRDVYFETGGFAAVRCEPLEDLALAHHLQAHGARVPLLRGFGIAQAGAYAGAGHLWKGLTRLGAGALKWSGIGGWLTALFITGALLPVLAVPLAVFAGMPVVLAAAAWAIVVAAFFPWMRGSGWPRVLLAPFGALFVQAAAVSGLVGRLAGHGFWWKGRRV